MSVIFFEGFNRTVDPNFWTLASSSNNSRLPALYGSGRTENSSYRLPTADVNFSATPCSMTAKFSPASLTKVYLGYVVDYLATQLGQYGGGSGAVSGAKQKHLTVYDATDAELFHISARQVSGGMAFSLYSSTYFGGANPIGSFIINNDTTPPGTYLYSEWYGAYMYGNWNHFEFEIDLVSNTVAARRNGQTLYTESTGALTVLLPDAMPSVGAFRFHGHPSSEYSIDDMYVATSAGTTANTWLGPNTRVYSPGFAASTPAEWSNGSSASAVNADDNDSSFISTNVINKVNVFDTGVSPSPSDAIVGGVKLLSVARKVTLDAAYRHVYKDTDGVIHNLSPNFDLTTTAYKRSSAFAFENPATASPWTLAELDSGKFGVKSVEYVPATGGTPVITIDTQPANQTPAANNTNTYTVSLAVSASATEGATLSYQWQKAEAEDPTAFTSISGAVLAVLSRPGLSYPTGNGDKYRVVVSATGGAANVTSAAATITIPPLTVPNAPTSVTGVSGNAQITVSWTAPAYTGGSVITDYKVAMSEDAGASWSAGTYVGSNTASLVVTGLVNGDGYKFKVLAVNAQGEGNYSAESASLVPVGEPLAITAQPANAYVSGTAAADFTVTATGSGLTYQWEGYCFDYDTYDFAWKILTGEQSATVTLTAAKLVTLDVTGYYGDPIQTLQLRCNVTDAATVTQTTTIARFINMAVFYSSPGINSNYGGLNYNSAQTIAGVNYEQYTPDQNAAANSLSISLYDYNYGGVDFSWFSGNEISIELQEGDDTTTWTTIGSPTTGHYLNFSADIPATTGTKYYRFLAKYLWPRTVTNTSVNSSANSAQSDYTFLITRYIVNWPSVPAVPTNVVGYPEDSEVVLFWTPPTNNGNSTITGYNVQTSTNNTTWSPWVNNPVNATSANITGLVNDTPYYFRVAAINGVGTGNYSPTFTAAASVRSFSVTDSGTGQYLYAVDGDGVANPTLTLMRGSTYRFAIDAAGHPFHFQTVPAPYSAGDVYTSGVTGSGTAVGEITFIVPVDAPAALYYVCEHHSSMGGQINISSGVTPFVLEPVADPAIGNVSLLLHLNNDQEAGADGTVTDNSRYNHTVSSLGGGAGAVIAAAKGRFGGHGIQFTSAESTCLSVPASTALDMADGNFTIEFWAFCTDNAVIHPSYLAPETGGYAPGAFTFRYDESGNANKFTFYWYTEDGSVNVTTSNTYSYNRWRHVALVREGTTVRIYIDGVQDGTMSIDIGRLLNMAYDGAMRIGSSLWDTTSGYIDDRLDELRITKGLCRYPSGTTFIPAAVPFANFGPPDAPTNLQLTTGDAQVSLTWTPPAFTGNLALTDYVVEYSTNGTTWLTFTDGVSTTAAAVVTGLLNGTTYYFRVAAKNSLLTGDPTAASSGVIPSA